MNQTDNSFRLSFMHLSMALQYFQDFGRQFPGSIGAKPAKVYEQKLNWILKDFKSNINFPSDTLSNFLLDMDEDPLALGEIGRLANKLSPKQKVALEEILVSLLKGETLTVVLNDPEKTLEPNY